MSDSGGLTNRSGPDGARMLAEAREIAFPRYPGTDGDPKARRIVAARLQEAGLDVREEEFGYDIRPAMRAIRSVLIASAVLVAVGAMVGASSPLRGLGVLAAGAIVGGTLLVWAPGVERLYARTGPTKTANVVGTRPARGEPRMTLVVMAHHDSKSQNLTFPVRMGLTILAIAGGVALLAILAAGAVSGGPVGPGWLTAAPAVAAVAALLVLSTLSNGNRSPGGVDNAGSVAILWELSRSLPREVPGDVELIFLATGAEEDHMVGAMRWLERHRPELEGRDVCALNFDGAGSPGRTVMMERYGTGKSFAPALARSARRASKRLGIPLRAIWMPPAMGIDAIPFDHHGVPCLTFSSGALGRATIAIHSAGDSADNLDPGALSRIATLAREVALDVTRQKAAEV